MFSESAATILQLYVYIYMHFIVNSIMSILFVAVLRFAYVIIRTGIYICLCVIHLQQRHEGTFFLCVRYLVQVTADVQLHAE